MPGEVVRKGELTNDRERNAKAREERAKRSRG